MQNSCRCCRQGNAGFRGFQFAVRARRPLSTDRFQRGSAGSIAYAKQPAIRWHAGEVQINSLTHEFKYSAPFGYVGSNSFSYTVSDEYGQISNLATVSITVTSAITFPWHNSDLDEDVNGVNGVTNLDAFLLIGEIRTVGPRSLLLPTAENHPWISLLSSRHCGRRQVGEGEELSPASQLTSAANAETAAMEILWDQALLEVESGWAGVASSNALKRRRR